MRKRANPRGPWWTAERRADLARRLEARELRADIATAMGTTTQAIYSAVHRFHPEQSSAYHWSPQEIEALADLLKAGASRGAAAKALGLPISAIKHAVKLHLPHLKRGPGGVPLTGEDALRAQIEGLARQVEQLTALCGRLSARIEKLGKPRDPFEDAVETLRRTGAAVYREGKIWRVDGHGHTDRELLDRAERARRSVSFKGHIPRRAAAKQPNGNGAHST